MHVNITGSENYKNIAAMQYLYTLCHNISPLSYHLNVTDAASSYWTAFDEMTVFTYVQSHCMRVHNNGKIAALFLTS